MIHGARVVHHIPGRLRVRLPRSGRDRLLLRELSDFAQSLGGVQSVEVNPLTGSLLIHYEPRSPEIAALLAGDPGEPPDLTEADELAAKIEREADFLAAHSEVALHMVQGVQSLNRQVRAATDNFVDLKVLLPAGLALWAFLELGIDVSTPLWVTLAIFSFNSFVILHRPDGRAAQPAVSVE